MPSRKVGGKPTSSDVAAAAGVSRSAWLPQPGSWAELSVAAQDGVAGSTLTMYRDALALRRKTLTATSVLTWPDAPEGVLTLDGANSSAARSTWAPSRSASRPPATLLIAS